MSVYIAILVRTRHLLILNRGEWQKESETCCLVLSNMMPAEDWYNETKLAELTARVREECDQFGGAVACVVPTIEMVPFVSQIFIAFREETHASDAQLYYNKIKFKHGKVLAQVYSSYCSLM